MRNKKYKGVGNLEVIRHPINEPPVLQWILNILPNNDGYRKL
jgi:hypothetical protein